MTMLLAVMKSHVVVAGLALVSGAALAQPAAPPAGLYGSPKGDCSVEGRVYGAAFGCKPFQLPLITAPSDAFQLPPISAAELFPARRSSPESLPALPYLPEPLQPKIDQLRADMEWNLFVQKQEAEHALKTQRQEFQIELQRARDDADAMAFLMGN
jgi:hypothetical protein